MVLARCAAFRSGNARACDTGESCDDPVRATARWRPVIFPRRVTSAFSFGRGFDLGAEGRFWGVLSAS